MGARSDLESYRRKRSFDRTPEPRGGEARAEGAALRFVVQKHAARRLHYDFRLELDGVLKSWAVPKGPSLVAGDRRLAAQTEDHPLEYAAFEGVIPQGEYGGGTVVVWDDGIWQPLGDPRQGLAKGELTFRLDGRKLRGRFHLVRLRAKQREPSRADWLLFKGRDEDARPRQAPPITVAEPRSVLTGRDLDEVARDRDRVWSSHAGEQPAANAAAHPSALPGARPAPPPRSVLPQLATLASEAPEGDEWLHELKLDGYRLLAHARERDVRLLTRAGNDWTDRFARLSAALAALRLPGAVLDGEAVRLDAHGRSRFQALQQAMADHDPELHFFLFDLLYLDGFDLRRSPLVERKRLLRGLLARAPEGSPLRYSDHQRGGGRAFFEEACRTGVEGIVSKRADSPYAPRRTRSWLKVKCTRRQELVIVGFTDPAGSRRGLGALLLAARDASSRLRYAGKVGTGLDTPTLVALRDRLGALERRTPPAAGSRRARGQHWVEPELVAEVAFTEWTHDGRVRHPSFVGLREDKPAREVRVERERKPPTPAAAREPGEPTSAAAAAGERGTRAALPVRAEVAGVRLSNPDRVYFPESGITKSELAQYYERMAERVLPGLVERPLSLVRCPEGREAECFFQKRAFRSIPAIVPRVVVKRGREAYAMVKDLASLVALVQVGVLELHVWGARADDLERPDVLVMDLDPDPELPWSRVQEAALLLRELFHAVGLVPFARSTGGKGLHVVVPLVRRSSWEEVEGFAMAAARELERMAPDRFTTNMSKAKRPGRIFLDVFRNQREATAIASWSTRARPGAPVAATLGWEELERPERPLVLLRDAAARLAGPDPWAGFEDSRSALSAAALRKLGAR